ncbi:hypothetical protein COCNU_01G002900 [Cocos nucifera]|uniref:Uncharacterized protein n=1 Tax=Cocos nucifera TaxID=13894 RepID=A0A8K0HTI1_COCNU|nr:hypothetical protein COCNU_01G002900 [Cocos nucifera]
MGGGAVTAERGNVQLGEVIVGEGCSMNHLEGASGGKAVEQSPPISLENSHHPIVMKVKGGGSSGNNGGGAEGDKTVLDGMGAEEEEEDMVEYEVQVNRAFKS